MTEDPYDILGVPRTATSDEIKKAYRKKARENHPDLNPDDPEAEERLKKINEAYDRITNPEKYARKADPTNDDYRQAEAVIGARARTYQQESESRGFGGCVDPSSLCCCLMCGPALCQPFLFCL